MEKSVIKNKSSNIKKAATATMLVAYLALNGYAGYKAGEAIKNHRAETQSHIEKPLDLDSAIIPFTVGASLFGAAGMLAIGADMVNDARKRPDKSRIKALTNYLKEKNSNDIEYDGMGRS